MCSYFRWNFSCNCSLFQGPSSLHLHIRDGVFHNRGWKKPTAFSGVCGALLSSLQYRQETQPATPEPARDGKKLEDETKNHFPLGFSSLSPLLCCLQQHYDLKSCQVHSWLCWCCTSCARKLPTISTDFWDKESCLVFFHFIMHYFLQNSRKLRKKLGKSFISGISLSPFSRSSFTIPVRVYKTK